MGLFNIFKNKNPNYLKPDEKEAAGLFQTIIKGYSIGQPNFIDGGVDKLSIGLYYLAFERSNKKVVPLDQMYDAINVATNPRLMQYFSLFQSIKETIEKTAENKQVQLVYRDDRQIEESILQLLQYCANQINKI